MCKQGSHFVTVTQSDHLPMKATQTGKANRFLSSSDPQKQKLAFISQGRMDYKWAPLSSLLGSAYLSQGCQDPWAGADLVYSPQSFTAITLLLTTYTIYSPA